MTATQALTTMRATYEQHATLTYSQIALEMHYLSTARVATLKEAATQFGVAPTKNTKAAILEAVRRKIETRKSTAVRCSF
jgi:hypothetical protein